MKERGDCSSGSSGLSTHRPFLGRSATLSLRRRPLRPPVGRALVNDERASVFGTWGGVRRQDRPGNAACRRFRVITGMRKFTRARRLSSRCGRIRWQAALSAAAECPTFAPPQRRHMRSWRLVVVREATSARGPGRLSASATMLRHCVRPTQLLVDRESRRSRRPAPARTIREAASSIEGPGAGSASATVGTPLKPARSTSSRTPAGSTSVSAGMHARLARTRSS